MWIAILCAMLWGSPVVANGPELPYEGDGGGECEPIVRVNPPNKDGSRWSDGDARSKPQNRKAPAMKSRSKWLDASTRN